MATISSSESATMISISAPEVRQNVHQAPTARGCKMIKTLLMMPSGTTAMPNRATIQGIVRQRRASPMKPDRISIMYA